MWTQLTAKANSRKEKLLDSYDLQRFLNDHRDLLAWINSMLGLVSSEELANDVTGAEALIERHQVIDCFHLMIECFAWKNLHRLNNAVYSDPSLIRFIWLKVGWI